MDRKLTRGRHFLLTFAFQALLALGALTMATGASAVSHTLQYDFNLRSPTNPQNGPNLVATLTLEEKVDPVTSLTYVEFTLDPNANALGVNLSTGNGTTTRIERLDIAFTLEPTVITLPATNLDWASISNFTGSLVVGAPVADVLYQAGSSLDAGYESESQVIRIDFFNANASSSDRLLIDGANSVWRINDVTLAQFQNTEAIHSAITRPQPVFGVISVAPISPGTSNYVAESQKPAMMVPEPTSLALLGIGMIGFVMVGRRRRQVEG